MTRADGLDVYVRGLSPRSTSYFSEPERSLDPSLFNGRSMHPQIRQELHDHLFSHLSERYNGPEQWTNAWVAGSAASYQWAADRSPGDLDILVGIDYPKFRALNEKYVRLSDAEISAHVTEGFRQHLTPKTTDFHGFETTWFSNPGSTDIRAIKPYAAYDFLKDEWSVDPDPAPIRPTYHAKAESDRQHTVTVLERYHEAFRALNNASLSVPVREKYQRQMRDAMEQASALFTEIHDGRKDAFAPWGQGYADPANFRWQANKANGVVPALKLLHDAFVEQGLEDEIRRYGVRLPDHNDLVLRAMVVTDE